MISYIISKTKLMSLTNTPRNVWCNDGHVFCKLSDERDERPLLLKHFDDIDYYQNK